MNTSDIFLIVFVTAVLAFSLYRRFIKNKRGIKTPAAEHKKNSSFSSGSLDDDYEPYMKK
jgi:uncharacterized membrane protein YobD (UPF0266 family)